ncbi:DSD1 family PLP-dependent enzyme [Ottowia pentelensis]|uniref:DSD1 family PLP-dependent enzyme n=1 Tax=Ottowia pentelensis TaxID=511108 RepID=UPI00363385A6
MNASLESLPATLQALIGQGVDAIDTPALVVDLDAAGRNLQRMAEFAARHRLRLRPHAKMHKSAAFAHLQLQAGAVGLCTQTVAEAEALAAAGIDDLFISNQVVAPAKLQRVAALAALLAARGGRLAIAVDSEGGIARLARAMQDSTTAIDVFVEVDIGQGRCGVAPGQPVLGLVRTLTAQAPALRYAGLHAYHGGAQHLRTAAERRAAIGQSAELLRRTVALLDAAELAPPLITGAGTGTFACEAASGLWSEIQPGSFLFMDADYARNERDPAQPAFEPALFIKSQVISVAADHAVCDAGHKSHAIDSGGPSVHALPGQPSLEAHNGGDEASILRPVAMAGGRLPALGDTVWLIPGHCDPTVNLHNQLIAVRGGLQDGCVDAVEPVLARGVW